MNARNQEPGLMARDTVTAMEWGRNGDGVGKARQSRGTERASERGRNGSREGQQALLLPAQGIAVSLRIPSFSLPLAPPCLLPSSYQ